MLQYPDIDPVAFSLGPLTVHWYGITYLIAFAAGWWLAKHRAKRVGSGWNPDGAGRHSGWQGWFVVVLPD